MRSIASCGEVSTKVVAWWDFGDIIEYGGKRKGDEMTIMYFIVDGGIIPIDGGLTLEIFMLTLGVAMDVVGEVVPKRVANKDEVDPNGVVDANLLERVLFVEVVEVDLKWKWWKRGVGWAEVGEMKSVTD
ncbi:Hypothetical predicted protein [Olea europaea subsp. europaea]|uniref:Uncharacterized protein n=1 Tax=Olea europaea subsp. europaea TaxID=158383 RepID=A0A8S0QB44_OLEEU|nr:Hypothetical predicted protein [Olea europaea subsp. europaea]